MSEMYEIVYGLMGLFFVGCTCICVFYRMLRYLLNLHEARYSSGNKILM